MITPGQGHQPRGSTLHPRSRALDKRSYPTFKVMEEYKHLNKVYGNGGKKE